MASGRHGGYRDNKFRERETDFKMTRKDFRYLKVNYDRIRDGDRDYERCKDLGVRVGIGYNKGKIIRQKGVKERVITSGGIYSHSAPNSGIESRCGYSVQETDREPGELSSDEALDSETHLITEIEAVKLEKENTSSSPGQNKKRKISPIVWDREQSKVNRGIKRKNMSESSPNAFEHISFANDNENHISKEPPSTTDLPCDVPENSAEITSLPPQEEGHVPVRTIISSRWANDADSPADEGEISDYENIQKSTSPELWKTQRGGFERLKGRLSSSDERVRSSSRDSYQENSELDYRSNSASQSDTESEDSAHPPQRSVNMLQGCRNIDEFEILNEIDEGTYGVVSRARDKKTGEIVALKKVKMENEREGFPLTALREINILLSCHHPSIVDVKGVVVDSSLDKIYMVMEYMEHDLKGLMKSMKQPFSQSEVKCLMLQLLNGVKYLHDNWVLHRDLKTSNILFNNRGELKICDFGMARQYGSPLKPYTQLVVTLWYRAPELLLGAKKYSTSVDMWSLGCIMAELLSKEPLFDGGREIHQLQKIFEILGTPNETIWPGFSKLPGVPGVKVDFIKHPYNLLRKKFPATSFTGSPVLSNAGFDLLNKLLTYDPEKRITAEEALNHEWFFEVPLPKSKEFMPTFPAQHAQDRRMRQTRKSPDPLQEQRRKELQQGELGTGGTYISVASSRESATVLFNLYSLDYVSIFGTSYPARCGIRLFLLWNVSGYASETHMLY